MRNQWRLLVHLQRSKSPLSILHYKKVQSLSNIYIKNHTTFNSHTPRFHFQYPRLYSSLSLSLEKNTNQSYDELIELYSDPNKTNEEIMLELQSKNNPLIVNDDYVNGLFKNRGTEPGSGKAFYDWVMGKGNGDLGSNSFNRLLGMLGGNGLVSEFWELVEVMKRKGYGVKKGASDRAMARFEKDGLDGDVERLKGLFEFGSGDGSVERVGSRVCKVIREGPWGDDVEMKLREMGVVFSGVLVKMVLENIGADVNKALIFFRWVQESGLYKHDEKTYNAMARVMAKEDYLEKFWRLVEEEMWDAGFDMEEDTYVGVLSWFVSKKMLDDAVYLYEFAMRGYVKPSVQDCTFLLRKIVTSDELDMKLFSNVLRAYKEGGNVWTNSVLDTVLKALTSVGRYGECNKILRAMEEFGFYPDEKLQGKIGFQLSKDGKTEEAAQFLDFMETSGIISSYKTWGSLIDGYCISGHLDKACDCFQKLIKNEGISCAGYALETLTNAYCSKGRAVEAYKLLSEVVVGKDVKPWHTTYKLLIRNLLAQGLFEEATNLFTPMKAHGYPPYLDPFVKYVTKSGTTDDTVMFLKAMTVKKVPSTAVYVRVFRAYLKAGRHSEAQEFLSKCPRFIRNNVDVLNLFSSMKPVKDTAATAIPTVA
uniref:pentatricopeptide repeat-containing protein At3g02490, mitochondrial-like n=1 Tax=Erigeron canadensis TaxID=72917 RepID=UPI001CB8C465|nr:pentatricopeptide repeat-containing protein At3g02490, mitochondrial-like [Erigeron canadensis]